ncbi:peptide MFS transporter [Apibacter raozihei]|uniref:peptide MFS transporter n=1 Tax=Apibacter raozihei TaxID=2500547 RepID=UPI000FE35C99|nr:peptide MFS transporter [Apibacter raozihei]
MEKHPKGLYFLFFTEMWERFGYYLMLGIFVLYMIDADTGGLAFGDKISYDIFGSFIALTYLTPFLGGFLADRILGYIKATYLGGTLMGLGYISLAFSSSNLIFFYVAIALIVVGNGFFKPSISTLLGNLYSEKQYKPHKDAGYNLFYMGINIGAFICNFIAAFMRNQYGWGFAFATAGIGMFVGLLIFTTGISHFKHANLIKPKQKEDVGISQVLIFVFLPAIVFGALGWFIPGNLFGSNSTDAFIFATIPIIIFYLSLYFRANKQDKKPIAALLTVFAVCMVFWAVFKQNGTALTNWAKYYTERSVSSSFEKPLETLKQVEKVTYQTEKVTQYDDQYRVIKDRQGNVSKKEGKDIYFRNMDKYKLPAEGQSVYLINPELFQSINPGWVIILTPLLIGFFTFLRKRKKEPSTPTKMTLGLFISGLSCLVMATAVYVGNNGEVKVSPLWLVISYGVITVGELCLSPMGLSLVSKLSPPRITALMMGGYFLSNSIGNKLSGILAGMWYDYEHKTNFFLVNFLLLTISFLIGLALLKWLNKIMKETENQTVS